MIAHDYQNKALSIINSLPNRQQEILIRRFGLKNGQKETLEKIGNDFDITRERVRQLENNGFQILEEKIKQNKEAQKVFKSLNQYLNKQGGLKRENILLSDIASNEVLQKNSLHFFLTLGEPFYFFKENEDFHSFWTIETNLIEEVKRILNKLLTVFEEIQKPLSEEEFFILGKEENEKFFSSSFEIFKIIEKGPFKNIGLVNWPEISPKRTSDRIYLVLKNISKPLHFVEITELINELEEVICSKKKILTQTVHNELIKDERFILIGRGIYALREWGYEPGFVKDIIIKLLKEVDQSLTREEIIERVTLQRQVKPNTIIINLQDKNLFLRNENGKYTLK